MKKLILWTGFVALMVMLIFTIMPQPIAADEIEQANLQAEKDVNAQIMAFHRGGGGYVYRPAPVYRYHGHHGGYYHGCFVATAAYGETHPNLAILREFRDKFLMTNSIGQSFVDFYYEHGPKAAEFVKDHNLQGAVRVVLWPIVKAAAMTNSLTP